MADLVGIETKYLSAEGQPLNVFEINWILGNKCNYRCSYCPDEKHGGSHPGLLDETSRIQLSKIMNTLHKSQSIDLFKFNFSGGEPTQVPEFATFCTWLKSEFNCLIHVNTNGSKTIQYWEQNWKSFDTLSLSFHSEFAKIDRYIENYRFLSQHLFAFAAVMMHPERWDKCISLIKEIECLDSYCYGLNIIFQNWPAPDMQLHPKYSKEQLNFLESHKAEVSHNISYTDISQELLTHWSDGSIRKDVSKQEVINRSLNLFEKWNCWIGLQHLSIFESGEMFTAGCHHKQRVGNLYSGEIKLFDKPLVCGAKVCHCHPYLAVKKHHPAVTETIFG